MPIHSRLGRAGFRVSVGEKIQRADFFECINLDGLLTHLPAFRVNNGYRFCGGLQDHKVGFEYRNNPSGDVRRDRTR